jgi:hypothetical protein
MKKVLVIFVALLLGSCTAKQYKEYKPSQQKNVCFKDFYINTPEPTIRDIMYKSISDAVLQSGNKLECGENTSYNLYAYLNNVRFYSIGYSPSQRANVYAVEISLSIKVEDIKGNILIDRVIREKTQYVGTGLLADFEKRYAFEELGNFVKVRVFSILSEL